MTAIEHQIMVETNNCCNKSFTKKPRAEVGSLSFEELIRELHAVFDGEAVNVDYVHELLSAYKSNPADWKKFAKFDRYRYTRNLVDEGNGKFNLMVLCWGEGHGSAIHDHANAHCFMKVLQGSLSEVRFAWPDPDAEGEGALQETERGDMKLNKVCYMSDTLGLHRVENPSHTMPAVSLHLYCPPFGSCSVFNQQTGQRTSCNVTFWSKFGEKRNREIQDSRAPEDN